MGTPQNRQSRPILAHRLAVATAWCAVPLVLFGGSVTTLGAGMAVEGWLVAEGHFLLVFPVEKWFRDLPTFVEHTHRLFGALVGLLAIATAVAAHRSPARLLAWGALAAVCAQGALGGFRVLENSPSLAFLHGALAQAVFALLCLTAARLRPRAATGDTPGTDTPDGVDASVRRWALATAALVLGQIVLGAWYRHGLRPAPVAGLAERLQLHLMGALVVFAVVAALHAQLKAKGVLPRVRRRLVALLAVQVGLGFLAWAGYRPDGVAPLEWICSVLHVLCGALLLAQCTVVALAAGDFALERGPRRAAERAGGVS